MIQNNHARIALVGFVMILSLSVVGVGSVAADDPQKLEIDDPSTKNATTFTDVKPPRATTTGGIAVKNTSQNPTYPDKSRLEIANLNDSDYSWMQSPPTFPITGYMAVVDASAISKSGTTMDVNYNDTSATDGYVDVGDVTVYKTEVDVKSVNVSGIQNTTNLTVEIDTNTADAQSYLSWSSVNNEVDMGIQRNQTELTSAFAFNESETGIITQTTNISGTQFQTGAEKNDTLYFDSAIESISLDGETVYDADGPLGGGGGDGSSNQTLLIGLVVAGAAVLLLTRD